MRTGSDYPTPIQHRGTPGVGYGKARAHLITGIYRRHLGKNLLWLSADIFWKYNLDK